MMLGEKKSFRPLAMHQTRYLVLQLKRKIITVEVMKNELQGSPGAEHPRNLASVWAAPRASERRCFKINLRQLILEPLSAKG